MKIYSIMLKCIKMIRTYIKNVLINDELIYGWVMN